MPKEQVRKRGKRKPKNADQSISYPAPATSLPADIIVDVTPSTEQPVAGPSSIHPARAALLKGERYIPPQSEQIIGVSDSGYQPRLGLGGEGGVEGENGQAQWIRGPRADQEFPFGEVDPDLKAYFRNVEEQIKDWEGTTSIGEEREGELRLLSFIIQKPRSYWRLRLPRKQSGDNSYPSAIRGHYIIFVDMILPDRISKLIVQTASNSSPPYSVNYETTNSPSLPIRTAR